MAGLTKAQIAERKAAEEAARQAEIQELLTRALEAEARAEEATKRADWYETMDRAADVDTDAPIPAPLPHAAAPESGAMPDQLEVGDPVVAYDPFDAQNPHRILADPPGFKLGWKNPLYRDGNRGWRGWLAVTYDSEIGRNLKRYLLDPPRKMEHAVDNYVRRGDSILCYLEADIWNARQQRRTDLASRRAGEHAKDVRVDRITKESDLRPLPASPNRVGGRSMTS